MDEDGFLVGKITLAGTDEVARQTFGSNVKNEHLVASRKGAVIAKCPDLISIVDLESGDRIVNPGYERGQAVAVLGFRCDPLWRTEGGLNVFSPRYLGYDLDYVPIEQILA